MTIVSYYCSITPECRIFYKTKQKSDRVISIYLGQDTFCQYICYCFTTGGLILSDSHAVAWGYVSAAQPFTTWSLGLICLECFISVHIQRYSTLSISKTKIFVWL